MIYTVSYFINKFEAIPEENWCRFRMHNEDQHCALGHCNVSSIMSEPLTMEAITLYNLFRSIGDLVTTVNDYPTDIFPQPHPKQRILAALYEMKQMQAVKQAEDIINSPAQLIA